MSLVTIDRATWDLSRTHIYAMGCLAFELLAGRHLFAARDLSALVEEKSAPRLPAAAEIGDGVSEELYEFLTRALSVDPNDRPSSSQALMKWAAPCQPPPEALSEESGEDPTV